MTEEPNAVSPVGNLWRTFKSTSLGVHPRQIEAAQKAATAAGISSRDAHFLPDGDVELTKSGRKQLMKLRGLEDMAAYSTHG